VAAPDLYDTRFSADERRAKNAVWHALCEDFFQRWVPLDATVLDLGAGFCEFVITSGAARSGPSTRRARRDLGPDVRVHCGPAHDLRWRAAETVDVVFASNVSEHFLANEFMMIAEQHDRDIYPIVQAINAGYKRGGLKSPGLTGGPCLYKDGFFLTNRIPYNELISSAWKINETVPAYLVDRARRLKRIEGSRAAILGLAFKKNIDDPRNSLSYKLRKQLLAEGAEVHVHDPFIASEPLEDVLRDADFIFIGMDHDAFRALTPEALRARVRPDALVCDIWNLLGTGRVLFLLNDL